MTPRERAIARKRREDYQRLLDFIASTRPAEDDNA